MLKSCLVVSFAGTKVLENFNNIAVINFGLLVLS